PGTERSNDRVTAVVPNRVEPAIPVQTQSDPPQQPRQGATIVDISGGDPSQVQFPRRDARQPQVAQNSTGDSNAQVGPVDNGSETAQVNSNDSRVPENLQQAARRNGQ